MNACACGELLSGRKKVCGNCQKKHKLERKRELRKIQAKLSWQCSIIYIARPKRMKLIEPISDDVQREIDAEVDRVAEKRAHLNPLDPRAIAIIRPSIWLWQ